MNQRTDLGANSKNLNQNCFRVQSEFADVYCLFLQTE